MFRAFQTQKKLAKVKVVESQEFDRNIRLISNLSKNLVFAIQSVMTIKLSLIKKS